MGWTPGPAAPASDWDRVDPITPHLTGVHPFTAVQGDSLAVRLDGDFFDEDCTIVPSIAGITVEDLVLVSHRVLTATLVVDDNADVGTATLKVNNLGGDSPAIDFEVTEGTHTDPFVFDTFAGGPVDLSAHVGEVGAAWASLGPEEGPMIVSGGYAWEPNFPGAWYLASGVAPSADWALRAIIVMPTNPTLFVSFLDLTGRSNGAGQGYDLVFTWTPAGFDGAFYVVLQLYDAGRANQLGDAIDLNMVAFEPMEIVLSMQGDHLVVTRNGVAVIDVIDATVPAGDRVAMAAETFDVETEFGGLRVLELEAYGL